MGAIGLHNKCWLFFLTIHTLHSIIGINGFLYKCMFLFLFLNLWHASANCFLSDSLTVDTVGKMGISSQG